MARIPQEFIDDLVGRVDIVELIDARVPLKKAGREFQACCPFHNEKTPSFTVSPQKQFYHCFGCGAHGTALGFIMEFDRLEFPDAVRELADHVGVEVPVDDNPLDRVRREEGQSLYAVLADANKWFQQQLPQTKAAVEYLQDRGLSGQTAKDFGLGFAPPGWDGVLKELGSNDNARQHLLTAGLLIEKDGGEGRLYDRFRERVMFPIRDARGRVIGFGGRVMGDGTPKYLNSPETPVFHKGRELYGLYEAKQSNRELKRLLVVEGYMDVIGLAEKGIRYAVATLGTAVTPEHLQRLFRTVPELVFCFDGDRAGRKAAWRALEQTMPQLRDGRQARFLFLPDGEDPDSLVGKEGAEAFEERLGNATSLSSFLFDSLAEQTDMRSIDGRARLVELARPLLKPVPPGAFRELLLQELADRSQLNHQRLSALLAREQQAEPQRPRQPQASNEGKPTAMRTALTLLLANPSLGLKISNPGRFENLAERGSAILVELLEAIHDDPGKHTGALLELWRGRPEGTHLAALATTDIPGEVAQHQQMLNDIIRQFDARMQKQRVDELLALSRAGDLDAAGREELKTLLASA